MLHVFGSNGGRLVGVGDASAFSSGFVWLDVFQPTRDEERLIKNVLGVEIPTREEMFEIEATNRLYEETTPRGALYYLTCTLISHADSHAPESSPVTFILSPQHLITVRYSEFMSFRTFVTDFQRNLSGFATPDRVLTGLLDRIVERTADILEHIAFEAETVSAEVFQRKIEAQAQPKNTPHLNLRQTLRRVGNIGSLDGKTRESLVSLSRLLTFLNETRTASFAPESRTELVSARTDIQSLAEQSHFLADKIAFLLDAILGLISLSQNEIIQTFSIAAVMFMPPTLIASIYGMNFRNMPELGWEYGYLFAVLLMVLSGLIPWLIFKKKGWL